MNAIHYAARYGALDVLKWLLASSEFQITTTDHTGATILHHAAKRHHIDVVKWLIDEKCFPIEARDHIGRTALHLAASCDNVLMVRCLLERGASLDTKDWANADVILHCASSGSLRVLSMLSSPTFNFPLRCVDYRGMNAIHHCARYGQIDV